MGNPLPRSAAKPVSREAPAPQAPARAPLIDLPRLRHAEPAQRRRLLAVTAVTALWFGFTVWAASFWFEALADSVGLVAATFFTGGLALVPSTMNMFIVATLLLDKRPPRRALARYPALSVLMYVRDQAQSIAQTIESIRRQEYPGPFEVILIDDASTDRTAQIVRDMGYRWIKVLRQSRNRGKAAAMNRALEAAQHDLVVTLDADAILFGDALWSMVERYIGVRARRACDLRLRAGAQFARQLADPRPGVGLLPWPGVDEADAVALPGHRGRRSGVHDLRPRRAEGNRRLALRRGRRRTADLGHAAERLARRLCRGRLLLHHRPRRRQVVPAAAHAARARDAARADGAAERELVKRRTSMLFVVWHLLFPWTDLAFTLGFVPGVILSIAYSSHLLMGPMVLTLLPAVLLLNLVIFFVMRSMFNDHGLKVRRNVGGLLVYVFGYSLLLQPARVAGYLASLIRPRPAKAGIRRIAVRRGRLSAPRYLVRRTLPASACSAWPFPHSRWRWWRCP